MTVIKANFNMFSGFQYDLIIEKSTTPTLALEFIKFVLFSIY